MQLWIEGVARAGGIEVAPRTGSSPKGDAKAGWTHASLARRALADIGGGASLHALEGGVLRLVGALRTAYRRRNAIRALSGLSDHTLKDIGVDRSEIRSVVEDMIRSTAAPRAGARASRRPIRRLSLAGTFLAERPCEEPC